MQCQLTKPEDKLVALSGIARLILEKVGTDYLAGLWRDELSDGLLWRVENCQQANLSPSTRPSVYRAPSWSWASIDAMLSTDPLPDIIGKLKSMIDIEEASVQCVTNDPTGQVYGGHIRLHIHSIIGRKIALYGVLYCNKHQVITSTLPIHPTPQSSSRPPRLDRLAPPPIKVEALVIRWAMASTMEQHSLVRSLSLLPLAVAHSSELGRKDSLAAESLTGTVLMRS